MIEAPPRLWPSIGMGLLSPIVCQLAAAMLAMSLWVVGARDVSTIVDPEHFSFPPGLFGLMIALTGLLSVIASLLAAYLSPVPLSQRLSLGPPAISAVGLLLALVAGLSLHEAWSELWVLLLGEEAFAFFELFGDPIADAAPLAALLLGLTIAIAPGISEELLFRGYVQTRLLQRLSPPLAVGLSGLLFALAHLHPLHVLLTLPLGIWLGILSWRARSIWPSVLLHAINNGLASAESRWQWEPTSGIAWLDLAIWSLVAAGSLALLRRDASFR